MGGDLLPIGRRVAYWRARRKMSQQAFADRLGKSKSWVDKIERGVRSLDRLSTIQEIAGVLRVDVPALLGRELRPADVAHRVRGADEVRAALSTYEIALAPPSTGRAVEPVERVASMVAHAWTAYQHARYPSLMDLLPDLLARAQRTHARDPGHGRGPLVDAYRVTALVLVKLGEAELAWLAADRAMAVATGDRALVAAAAVQLGQVLRAAGRARSAMTATLAAAYRIAPPDLDTGGPEELSLCGALLVQAGLSAARLGDDSVAGLIDEAADLAAKVGEGRDDFRIGFGPTAVDLARVAAAVDLGDGRDAVAWHEKVIDRPAWRWLPAEHRAEHLVNAARGYLQAGDPAGAGRVLMDAERTAPAEIHHRPLAREVVAQVARCPVAPSRIVHLAATIGVT
ncbi:helix-turn-helix domain-containing protein [Micromonospora sp. NPDC047074]|uniref:helix-turn-helix domain-containing protein n=1 Tax=Micromonospora sp. NPDC047074 TaxID=3154339 RepID=UPI0034022A21